MPPDVSMSGPSDATYYAGRGLSGFKVRAIQAAATLLFAVALVMAGLVSVRAGASVIAGASAIASALRSAELQGSEVIQDGEAQDAAVTANVKNAIAASIGPSAAQINVETRAAVVTLSGEAASAAIRDRAREAAWLVSGVVDVVDRIVVKSTG